jgi:hypothetical protein
MRKRKPYGLLALVLLALIAAAGFRAWPVLLDFWQTGARPALASHLAVIEGNARLSQTSQLAPASAPASTLPKPSAPIARTVTPPHALPQITAAPEDSQTVAPAPMPANTSIAPVAPAPSAERADSEPKPTAAADAAEKQIAAYLAGAGLTDTVQIHAAGDTLTLSGKLTSEEYRDLMSNLRDLPAGVRVIDHIEFDGGSPEASAATATSPRGSAALPASIAAATWSRRLGWVVARTVPRGALITVDGVATNQQTPAKLDLAAGQHLILFSLAGYTAESSVIVHPGRGSQIFQVLDRP